MYHHRVSCYITISDRGDACVFCINKLCVASPSNVYHEIIAFQRYTCRLMDLCADVPMYQISLIYITFAIYKQIFSLRPRLGKIASCTPVAISSEYVFVVSSVSSCTQQIILGYTCIHVWIKCVKQQICTVKLRPKLQGIISKMIVIHAKRVL